MDMRLHYIEMRGIASVTLKTTELKDNWQWFAIIRFVIVARLPDQIWTRRTFELKASTSHARSPEFEAQILTEQIFE